jgi:hypothetical protein
VVTEPRVRFRKETGLSDQGDRTASDPQRTFAGAPPNGLDRPGAACLLSGG